MTAGANRGTGRRFVASMSMARRRASSSRSLTASEATSPAVSTATTNRAMRFSTSFRSRASLSLEFRHVVALARGESPARWPQASAHVLRRPGAPLRSCLRRASAARSCRRRSRGADSRCIRHPAALPRARLDDEPAAAPSARRQAGQQVLRRRLRRAARQAPPGQPGGQRLGLLPSGLHAPPQRLGDETQVRGLGAEPLRLGARPLVHLAPTGVTLARLVPDDDAVIQLAP